ncbi:DNA-binding transcriptional regulator, MurR/RpiR family, contains HTH and SIS domains [Parafrankia irregularis]|uniref:DNA-binding transcriptional regulator, MurR/RpiR family, contains HTH and SIS domains n=2 Tax=Frankiaceae TaxID=74712 RepID=A0A0S4QKI3_9ACTN|nr:MurR/RpiR family transcriptional regulator [Parafrankia sp. CH37]CUU55352.1 DNA-binding transcriptional regulator, MurR/RpiR family, contains HTH and SIS domains [Parafrankia irregularis]
MKCCMATPGNDTSTAPAGAPLPGGLFAVVQAALPGLIRSERRVAEVCLAQPDDVVQWSVAELAAAAGVSTATVVRACQHLGFRGFQHMRLELARQAGALSLRDARAPLPDDPPERVVDAVFATAAEALTDALGPLDRGALAPAVDLLVHANRLLLVGNGGSAPVAQDAALRFITIGRPAEAPTDSITQALAARLLAPTDVCMVITSSGANEPTLRAAEAARAAGAPVIAITSYSAGPITELATVLLVVGTPGLPLGSETIASRLSSLLLLNALQLAVMLRIPADASAHNAGAIKEVLDHQLRTEAPSSPRRRTTR